MRRDVVRHGAALISPFSRKWLTPPDIRGPLVVLVHGFTADGKYLKPLAELCHAYKYSVALFEYDSYEGLERSSAALRELLTDLEPHILHGYSLVGHSMGGLVTKLLATERPSRLRALAMLATPNVASFKKPELLNAVIRVGETLGPLKPFGRSIACQAAKELAGVDRSDVLRSLSEKQIDVPVLSVSGGMAFVEFGSSAVGNAIANHIVQYFLGVLPNDGLVPESSANATAHVVGMVNHVNDYSEYPKTNHSGIFRNQEVALRVVNWLKKHHI